MLKTGNIHQGRDYSILWIIHFIRTVLVTLLLYYIPTFVACTPMEPEKDEIPETMESSPSEEKAFPVRLTLSEPSGTLQTRCLDIFIFNDDEERKIDSYKRIENYRGSFLFTASRTGKKILVILANSSEKPYSWENVHSWSCLERTLFQIEKENPTCPVMVAIKRWDNNTFTYLNAVLSPLMSKIKLSKIDCTIQTGKYAGKKLQDIRCYLTNVCQQYPAVQNRPFKSSSYLNSGRWSEEDMKKMTFPSLLYKKIAEETEDTEYNLYCYPNLIEETGIGRPFTRLVIEGRLGETTYYYPINLDMESWHQTDGRPALFKGVGQGLEYEFQIQITRPGVLDPDTVISAKDLGIRLNIRPWDEKEKEIIDF